MQKRRKHIAFILLFSILVYSSAQAFIIQSCECQHNNLIETESTSCCATENVIQEEAIHDCCSTDISIGTKFVSTQNNSCDNCSGSCSLSENIEYSSPTLFASISFSLKNIDKIEIEYIDLNNDKFNTSNINNKLKHTQNDEIPKLFGKNLLIQTHTLKIPLILV